MRLASRRTGDGEMSRDRLLAAASELGLSAADIDRAEQELIEGREEEEDRQAYLKEVRRKALEKATSWVMTSFLLLGINLFTGGLRGGHIWAIYPIGFWGIFVLKDILEFMIKNKLRQEEDFRLWRERRGRRSRRKASGSYDAVLVAQCVEDAQGDKAEAVRRYQRIANVGPGAAKDAVDAFFQPLGR